jgi:hypothetical protein
MANDVRGGQVVVRSFAIQIGKVGIGDNEAADHRGEVEGKRF